MSDPIKFTDEQGRQMALGIYLLGAWKKIRDATPDDLARAGYVQDNAVVIAVEAALQQTGMARELEALRALEKHVRGQVVSGFWFLELENIIKAIDEARKP